jgi:uncharacterized protein
VVVGVARWELILAGCHSLKDKRRVVSSLKARLYQRCHVSAAEVDHQDAWQRAAIAAAVVSPDLGHAQEVLTACERLVEGEPQALIASRETVWH